MKKIMNRRVYQISILAVLLVLILSACAAQRNSPVSVNTAAPTAASANTNTAAPTNASAQAASVSYTLTTGMREGKMVFIGVGGDLEGQVNPELTASPGDTVSIKLVNGDAIQHDLVVPDFNAATEKISERGSESTVTFQVDQEGRFAYFCSVPGHRQAGMEGALVVGQPAAPVETVTTSIVRDPTDLPPPLNRTSPQTVRVDLETLEVQARLADGVDYTFWTFNGKVPGPFLRVMVGDTVEVFLKNGIDSTAAHSVDFHAVTGPGGGSVATQTQPGGETSFTFQPLNPGLYVYHCATPMVAHHITNGMYGLILVEPPGGLPAVDREFYVMQGELYTGEDYGQHGAAHFSEEKLLDEQPEYFVFNGAVGALTDEKPLKANTGETVRIFFGVGGPNFTSSFHIIGEILDRVYDEGSLASEPLTNVQTTTVPPGGSTMVELELQVPGRYILVDHALSRAERGLAGYLIVDGEPNPAVFDAVEVPGSGH